MERDSNPQDFRHISFQDCALIAVWVSIRKLEVLAVVVVQGMKLRTLSHVLD